MNAKAVGIATAAMINGVMATSEPKTTARTTRAPSPASRVSTRTLLPPPWPPEARMVAPVTRTGAPCTCWPARAASSRGTAVA